MAGFDDAGVGFDDSGIGFDASGIVPIAVIPACGFSWRFDLLQPGLAAKPLHPKLDISIDLDVNRDVSRSVGGIVLVPEERQKCDFARDSVKVYLVINGTPYPMGLYRFTESSSQKGVVKTRRSDLPQDIYHVSLNDRAIELKRNTGEAQTLIHGTDPSEVMRTICTNAGIPFAIASALEPISNDVTWDGGTEDLDKVRQLAELSGHRPPWTDNNGVLRSISAELPVSVVYPLSQFKPAAESIVVTDNYLSAPNRVIVTDNSFASAPIRGQWDAPGSAPNSAGQRGFVQTQMVDQAGLGSQAAAQSVARTIGESLIARQLTAEIIPTYLLDGPVVLSYDNTMWRLQSWSVSTGVGELMSIEAVEIIPAAEAE